MSQKDVLKHVETAREELEIIEENPKITAELVKGLRKEIIEAGVSNIGISVA